MAKSLTLEGVRKQFGALQVLTDVNLEVKPGERRAIIGPNGAGKTTLFNIIAGELKPTGGKVKLSHQEVTGHLPNHLSHLGVARTFQKNNLFLGLTVMENVRLAVQAHCKGISNQFWKDICKFLHLQERTEEILEQLNLISIRNIQARNLSYGEQRQLEIGMALATDPEILLLDEPTAGMSPAETIKATQMISQLPRELTLLIIEHDMEVVLALADRIFVLHHGKALAEGTPEEIKRDPKVMEVYLGTEGVTT
ncbi:MAG: ABC transporter ATP-binding protein [Clostridia bacterium]|nr:ABC transporter ATP-binding protein [Clostridia bacterium]